MNEKDILIRSQGAGIYFLLSSIKDIKDIITLKINNQLSDDVFKTHSVIASHGNPDIFRLICARRIAQFCFDKHIVKYSQITKEGLFGFFKNYDEEFLNNIKDAGWYKIRPLVMDALRVLISTDKESMPEYYGFIEDYQDFIMNASGELSLEDLEPVIRVHFPNLYGDD